MLPMSKQDYVLCAYLISKQENLPKHWLYNRMCLHKCIVFLCGFLVNFVLHLVHKIYREPGMTQSTRDFFFMKPLCNKITIIAAVLKELQNIQ